MKKTFKLQVANKHPDRQVEAIKNEIRKYIKREKKKPLSDGFDHWNFNCKFGKNDETPAVIGFPDITKCIDEAASENCETFYMEIIAQEAVRPPKEEKAEEVTKEITDEQAE